MIILRNYLELEIHEKQELREKFTVISIKERVHLYERESHEVP